MAELNLREDPIGRTIRTLSLRDSATNAAEGRGRGRGSAPGSGMKPAFSPAGPTLVRSPVAGMRSPSAASRPMSATASSALAAGAPRSPMAKREAAAAIPYATGTPTEAAAALAYFQTLERQRDEAVAKNAVLEDALSRVLAMMTEHVGAVEASAGPLSSYYSVTFGAGHVGMILTSDDAGNIEVAELRDDRETGRPLLAKASGKIFVHDQVLAVNNRLLSRHGPPTPEDVAAEFRAASRPMTVLFRRNAEARLRAAMGAGDA